MSLSRFDSSFLSRIDRVKNRFLLNTHAHSPLARAMYSSILMAKLNDKFQDPLYIFLELVRAGVMHGHLWSNRAFSGGPSFGTGMFPLSFPTQYTDDDDDIDQ